MISGLRWRRLVVVQECCCRAVEAGVAAEVGFDQSGDWELRAGVTSARATTSSVPPFADGGEGTLDVIAAAIPAAKRRRCGSQARTTGRCTPVICCPTAPSWWSWLQAPGLRSPTGPNLCVHTPAALKSRSPLRSTAAQTGHCWRSAAAALPMWFHQRLRTPHPAVRDTHFQDRLLAALARSQPRR
jgi:hypothetical protein